MISLGSRMTARVQIRSLRGDELVVLRERMNEGARDPSPRVQEGTGEAVWCPASAGNVPESELGLLALGWTRTGGCLQEDCW